MDNEVQRRIDAASAEGKRLRKDNYFNQYSGFGGNKDPFNRATFQTPVLLKRTEVEDMYAGSWIVRRAIEVLIEDATRAWVDFKTDDDEVVKSINSKAKDLKLRKEVFESLRLDRL